MTQPLMGCCPAALIAAKQCLYSLTMWKAHVFGVCDGLHHSSYCINQMLHLSFFTISSKSSLMIAQEIVSAKKRFWAKLSGSVWWFIFLPPLDGTDSLTLLKSHSHTAVHCVCWLELLADFLTDFKQGGHEMVDGSRLLCGWLGVKWKKKIIWWRVFIGRGLELATGVNTVLLKPF